LFELLENRYQARWIEEQQRADQKARKMEFDKVRVTGVLPSHLL